MQMPFVKRKKTSRKSVAESWMGCASGVKEPRAKSKRRGVEVSRGDPVSPERKLPRSNSARGKYRKRFATFSLGEGRMRSGAVKKIKAD